LEGTLYELWTFYSKNICVMNILHALPKPLAEPESAKVLALPRATRVQLDADSCSNF